MEKASTTERLLLADTNGHRVSKRLEGRRWFYCVAIFLTLLLVLVLVFLAIPFKNPQLPFLQKTNEVKLDYAEERNSSHNQSKSQKRREIRSKCSDGWQYYGTWCYKASTENEKKTWDEANAVCRQTNSLLVSIHSNAEADFLRDLTGYTGGFWIGGRALQGRNFKWLDGTDFDFENWQPGEPNNWKGTQETCMEQGYSWQGETRSDWNDNTCDMKKRFVCKRCEPSDRLESVMTCNNMSPSPLHCSHTVTQGITDTHSSTKGGSKSSTISSERSMSLQIYFLNIGSTDSTSVSNSKHWETTNAFSTNRVEEIKYELKVPPWHNFTAYQLVGYCGPLVVRSNVFINKDETVETSTASTTSTLKSTHQTTVLRLLSENASARNDKSSSSTPSLSVIFVQVAVAYAFGFAS